MSTLIGKTLSHYRIVGELPAAEISSAPTAAPATGAGVALGTAGHMAPEQVRGQPADRIASVGSTGRSTEPHVHFELRRDDVSVDPTPLVLGLQ